jgi:hypothetical protein
VAYLRGDRAAAIAALRRAIELDPENPLFRTNLARLEADAARAPAPAPGAERPPP